MLDTLKLAELIDKTVIKNNDDSFRNHLGASIIGNACQRQLWYSFHWFDSETLTGRQLRLFNRGHLEEDRFVKLLEAIGAKVWTCDESGKQFRFKSLGGHFAGSLDGVATDIPNYPEPVLLEFKTSNDKNFQKLKREGIRSAKPVHYKQTQVYLRAYNLKSCLYIVVNKNDEELYFESFDIDIDIGRQMEDKAESIIFGEGMPPRISETSGWFECRFCAMCDVCHNQKTPLVNCRTCAFSKPERDGTWSCSKNQDEINSQPMSGCDNHKHKYEI